MRLDLLLVLLFCAATAVAIVARWLKVPYTVALVVAGMVLGGAHLFEAPHLTKALLFTIFLPGLIFEAAFHLETESLWRNKLIILFLAVPGVLLGMLLIAALLGALRGAELGFAGALVFAAIIVATDPVAVLAIFRSMAVPEELATIVEAESLLNDGTGVVVFELVLAIALGLQPTPLGIAGQFAWMVVGGAAIGALVGGLVWLISVRVDDPMIEVTLTVIAAYGSFGFAEQVGASGVIASVAAGLLCGASKKQMKAPTLSAVDNFWEYVAFALNSLVFLLMGLSVRPMALLGDWLTISIAWVAVTLSRGALLFAVTAGIRIRRKQARWRWAAVATWAGLRGALAMTLALSLPDALPGRELLIHLTFGVVLLTLVVQGLTIGPLVRLLGVSEAVAEHS